MCERMDGERNSRLPDFSCWAKCFCNSKQENLLTVKQIREVGLDRLKELISQYCPWVKSYFLQMNRPSLYITGPSGWLRQLNTN